MSEMQISPAVMAIVGCVVMVVLSVVSTVVFYKKSGDSADNPGSVLSMLIAAPFFLSLCYLMWIVIEKVGKSI